METTESDRWKRGNNGHDHVSGILWANRAISRTDFVNARHDGRWSGLTLHVIVKSKRKTERSTGKIVSHWWVSRKGKAGSTALIRKARSGDTARRNVILHYPSAPIDAYRWFNVHTRIAQGISTFERCVSKRYSAKSCWTVAIRFRRGTYVDLTLRLSVFYLWN